MYVVQRMYQLICVTTLEYALSMGSMYRFGTQTFETCGKDVPGAIAVTRHIPVDTEAVLQHHLFSAFWHIVFCQRAF